MRYSLGCMRPLLFIIPGTGGTTRTSFRTTFRALGSLHRPKNIHLNAAGILFLGLRCNFCLMARGPGAACFAVAFGGCSCIKYHQAITNKNKLCSQPARQASASSSSSLISMMSAAPLSFSDSESVLLSSVGLAWQAYGIGTKLWCPCDWKAIKFAPVPHYAHRNGISHRCLPATYKHSNNICRSESKSELLSLCKIHICYQQGKNNEQ